jgi:transcriptional regulator with XRE-family HTH domain
VYRESFPSKLKKARENTGMNQREVAKAIGVVHTTISKYENGLLEPDMEKLGLLADFYGVSVDWLLGTAGGKKVNHELDGVSRSKNNSSSAEMMINIRQNV